MAEISTRDSILDKANSLFRQRGYFDVSLREIAAELGISIGNLTYHFKKKEDLIEAVILKEHAGYRSRSNIPGDIREMDTLLREIIFEDMASNQIYFINWVRLFETYPQFRRSGQDSIRRMATMMENSVDRLIQEGLLKNMPNAARKKLLVDRLMMTMLYGLNYYHNFDCQNPPQMVYDALWSTIRENLTEEGLHQWFLLQAERQP